VIKSFHATVVDNSVGFPTNPKDSTGVAHILEHTTLCGSRRFPVRDPFFKMLTRSLATFMNAFTGIMVCVVIKFSTTLAIVSLVQPVIGQCTHLVLRMIKIFITFSQCILTLYFIHNCVLLISGTADYSR
jgi:hypothetical protein